MPTIQVEAHLSREDLLTLAEQLEPAELQQFVADLLGLCARRNASLFSPAETELLLIFNHGLPEKIQVRYRDLIAKRRQQTLTPEEHNELLRLTDVVEQLEADRLTALSELAQLRQSTVPALMGSLGLQGPVHE
jgi:hypothetical protein